ncbi:MAG: DUF3883 domain-containing protein [Chloroflexi bacterium]|nr:DUF3883 domain-containing protein [Chloroflexota bacterium]
MVKKVLWVKFGWSDYYRGGPVEGNFDYLAGEGNVGHEAYNIQPAADGTYYCYVPPQKRSAPRNSDPTGWTVVCLAKHPRRKGIHIVGWYENATLHGSFRDVPDTRAHRPAPGRRRDACWKYCISSKTAYFVPLEERTMPFSHPSVGMGKYSFLRGPGVRKTANKEAVLKLLKRRLKKLRSVAIKNPADDSAPDPGTDPADPLGGFGSPEHRKKVEKAAEEAVKKRYFAKGFSCTDVTKKNLGFDFIFRKGRTERHVEVKGTSGDLPRFFMTRNENAYRENAAWRFAIVTNALGQRPTVRVYDNRKFKTTFELDPYVYTGEPVITPR